MTIQLQVQPATYDTMTQSSGISSLVESRGLLEVLVARAVGHFTVLRAWNERARQRHHLSQLDDRLLADIGVSRAAAAQEAAKQPWEA